LNLQDPQAFVMDMKDLFDGLTLEQVRDHTSEVIGDILERVRRHQVDVKGIISTVVVTTLVLEGWSTKLNPDIRILETLKV
jgi:aarF domain-containing kinase